MIQSLVNAMGQLMKIVGILNIYSGLIMIAGKYYLWGVLFLIMGFAFWGLNEEGRDK